MRRWPRPTVAGCTLRPEILERVYAGDVDAHSAELAHHFCLAAAAGGDVERAVAYASRAARRATRLLAFEEAVRLYELALRRSAPRGRTRRAATSSSASPTRTRARETRTGQATFPRSDRPRPLAGLPDRLARAALGYGGRFIWARSTTEPLLLPLLDEALAELATTSESCGSSCWPVWPGALRPGARASSTAGRPAPRRRPDTGARRLRSRVRSTNRGCSGTPWRVCCWRRTRRSLSRRAARAGRGDHRPRRERRRPRADLRALDHVVALRWAIGDAAGVEAAIDRAEALAAELAQPAQHWLAAGCRTMLLSRTASSRPPSATREIALELGRRALAPANAETANAVHRFLSAARRAAWRRSKPTCGAIAAQVPLVHAAAMHPAVHRGGDGRRARSTRSRRTGSRGVPFGDSGCSASPCWPRRASTSATLSAPPSSTSCCCRSPTRGREPDRRLQRLRRRRARPAGPPCSETTSRPSAT